MDKTKCETCGVTKYGKGTHYGCPGKITPELAALVEAVREHAIKNYERGGWDILVETYDAKEIVEVIGECTDLAGALIKCAEAVGVIASVRSDVWGSGGLCTECAAVEPDDCVHRKAYCAGDIVHWRADSGDPENGPSDELTIEAGEVVYDCPSYQDMISVMHGPEHDAGMIQINRKCLVER